MVNTAILILQVSKEARSEEKEGSPNRKSPKGKGEKEADKEAAPADAKLDAKADAPQLTTLLEFIAWLALQWREQDSGSRSRRLLRKSSGLGWAAGRGGFLGDELEAVQEASIRLQVNIVSRWQDAPCSSISVSITLHSAHARSRNFCDYLDVFTRELDQD